MSKNNWITKNEVSVAVIQGKTVFIDTEDLVSVSSFKWRIKPSRSTFYVTRNKKSMGKQKTITLHRVIMQTPDDLVVDHIDGNGLNNRKVNLRNIKNFQNLRRAPKYKKDALSKFKGVYLHTQVARWVAKICIEGKSKHIGIFKSEIEAAQAYNRAAKQVFGEFAYLNEIKEKK